MATRDEGEVTLRVDRQEEASVKPFEPGVYKLAQFNSGDWCGHFLIGRKPFGWEVFKTVLQKSK